MDYNTVLRSMRYALNYSDQQMADICALDGLKITSSEIKKMLLHEEDDGFTPVENDVLVHFLDGLILKKRGPADSQGDPAKIETLDNNMIMKKLRIAMELREEEMIKTIGKGGFFITKAELSALFRKKGHKHFRPCGDQVLRYFLKGLSIPD